ncbi:MAG: hypothetical protein L0I76_29715 [Pseudonocardia sp.]|nr:hypothetical protein [Pseudonocardia sp.]
MSTNRRRPTGASRRPQVAGHPRTAGPSEGTEAPEGVQGTLAVEERTGTRPGVDRSGTDRPDAAPPTTTREPMAPVGGSSPGDSGAAGAGASGEPAAAGPGTAEAAGAGSDPTEPGAPAAGGSGDATRRPRGRRRIPLPSAPATRRGTAVLLAVTVLLTGVAVFFAVSWFGMRFTGSATNTALSDVGTTATVSEQIGDAATKVYSFDFARLDQAEADARAGITAPFDQQFDEIFGNVRQLAPKQQAVVTATVPKSAVASIEGDRATVYMFVDQVITRVDDTGKKVEGGAAARLRVDAQHVDGRWKISGMSPA